MNTNRLTEAQNRYARAVLSHGAASEKHKQSGLDFEALKVRQHKEFADAQNHVRNCGLGVDQAKTELNTARRELDEAIVETSAPRTDREQFWNAAAQRPTEAVTVEATSHPVRPAGSIKFPHRNDCAVWKSGDNYCNCGRHERFATALNSAAPETDCPHLNRNTDGTTVECRDCGERVTVE